MASKKNILDYDCAEYDCLAAMSETLLNNNKMVFIVACDYIVHETVRALLIADESAVLYQCQLMPVEEYDEEYIILYYPGYIIDVRPFEYEDDVFANLMSKNIPVYVHGDCSAACLDDIPSNSVTLFSLAFEDFLDEMDDDPEALDKMIQEAEDTENNEYCDGSCDANCDNCSIYNSKEQDKSNHSLTRLPFINAEDSREFIKEFNKNKISDELLESCRKAGELFGHHCYTKEPHYFEYSYSNKKDDYYSFNCYCYDDVLFEHLVEKQMDFNKASTVYM